MDLHENLKGKTVVITGGSGILCRDLLTLMLNKV